MAECTRVGVRKSQQAVIFRPDARWQVRESWDEYSSPVLARGPFDRALPPLIRCASPTLDRPAAAKRRAGTAETPPTARRPAAAALVDSRAIERAVCAGELRALERKLQAQAARCGSSAQIPAKRLIVQQRRLLSGLCARV